jgi:ribosomal protein L11 methyltransferase
VTALVAAGFAHPGIAANAPFDLIMANILAGPLLKLAPDIARVAAAGGHLILSGLLDEQEREVRARYLAQGFSLEGRMSLEGWTALHMRRLP